MIGKDTVTGAPRANSRSSAAEAVDALAYGDTPMTMETQQLNNQLKMYLLSKSW